MVPVNECNYTQRKDEGKKRMSPVGQSPGCIQPSFALIHCSVSNPTSIHTSEYTDYF